MIFLGNHGERAYGDGGAPIPTRLVLKQDVFDIVYNNCVRFIGFAEKTRAVTRRLKFSIGDFMPNNRRQVVETNGAAVFLNAGVQRKNDVTTKVATRQANITNDNNETASRNKNTINAAPNLVKLV